MDNMPVYAIFFQSVPECFIFYWLALQLFKINIKFSRLLCIAIIYGVCSFFIRGLSISFGVHTILQTLLIILVFVAIMKISLYQAITVSLFGSLTAITFEILFVPILLNITGLTLINIVHDPILRVVCPLPHMIVALTIVLTLRKNNIYLVDLSRGDDASPAGGQHH